MLGGDLISYDRERFDLLVLIQMMSWLDVKFKDATVVGSRDGFDFGLPRSLST